MFLPICKEDMKNRGWDSLDFILITGDAYVDHPSFGTAIIGRVLESHGYKVGVIAQPDWRTDEDFTKLGVPRYGFMVSSGNIDSMVNHYTVAKKRRSKDVYTPGDEPGKRPDRAVIVYCQKLRQIYKNTVPIMIGGLEASLRRFAHYDYWDDTIRRSVLIDSQADLLMYGMGEHQCIEIAEGLQSGLSIQDITFIKGTAYKTNTLDSVYEPVLLPDYNEVKKNKEKYAESFMIQYENTDAVTAETLAEPYGSAYVVQNPPSPPLTQKELDKVYGLPYMRNYHPVYEKAGGISAIEEVKYSIVSNRGCFGNCNFCALAFHQGRVVTARSHPSIMEEAKAFTWDTGFKGYIHDVGGPTANFRQEACQKQLEKGACKHKQCLYPQPCKQLNVTHKDYVLLLRKLREIPGIKKVFIRSGIRYDYLMADKDDTFFYELCEHHISGQLKVAPEHIHEKVLEKMGKPGRDVYDRFTDKYKKINEKLGKKQYLVPYLMSSHPGSDLQAAVQLAEYLQQSGFVPEQVQDFYPTPGTLSTCMYYTGIDPRTKEKVYIAKSPREKAMQRALIQYRNPKNYALVEAALKKAGRADLIGFGKNCLIRPKKQAGYKEADPKKQKRAPKKIRNVHHKKSK